MLQRPQLIKSQTAMTRQSGDMCLIYRLFERKIVKIADTLYSTIEDTEQWK